MMDFMYAKVAVTLMLAVSLCQAHGKADTMTWNERREQIVNYLNTQTDEQKRIADISAFYPKFCGADCARFYAEDETEDYEERHYTTNAWVSTSLKDVDFKAGFPLLYGKLRDYFNGDNDRKEKMGQRVPVLVSVTPGPGPAGAKNLTMFFSLEPKLGYELPHPAPSDKTVILSKLPSKTVYVRSFGGFASEESWLENAEKLAKALHRDSRSFIQDVVYLAQYDHPLKKEDRHNEVWYMAQNE